MPLEEFPFVKELLAHHGGIANRMSKAPARIHRLDNSLGFGARFVLRLKDGRPVGAPQRDEASYPDNRFPDPLLNCWQRGTHATADVGRLRS